MRWGTAVSQCFYWYFYFLCVEVSVISAVWWFTYSYFMLLFIFQDMFNMLMFMLDWLIYVSVLFSCLTFFPHIGHTSADTVLQSRRFLAVLPGDNVTLDCSMAAGGSMSSYTMYWYKQVHSGQPIEFVIKEYDQPVKNYEATLNNNMFRLIISSLTAQDSGTYFCAASHSEVKVCRLEQEAWFHWHLV